MVQMKRKPVAASEFTNKKQKLITNFFAKVEDPQTHHKGTSQIIANAVKVEIVDTKTAIFSEKKALLVQETILSKSTETPNETIVEKSVQASVQNPVDSTFQPGIDQVCNKSLLDAIQHKEFCEEQGFNQEEWVSGLSEEEKLLLELEIKSLHVSWLAFLHKELTKPYFLKLKRFLHSQMGKTVFPPPENIYSWSHYTPLPEVKCLVLGQDPYHNFNQAHGLAFSVLEPTQPPPSLLNIYKALKIDFPNFEIPTYNQLLKSGKPGGGNLTQWAKRGVLMLNACLTVEAHKANSHSSQGWEQFTERVIEVAIAYARDQNKQGFVIMAWGTPAQKRVAKFHIQLSQKDVPFLVLKAVHPSPLSAHRGFFDLHVFHNCNMWLKEQGKEPINWGLLEGNDVL